MPDTDIGNWIPVGNILPAEGVVVLLSIQLANGHQVSGFGTMNGFNNWQLTYAPTNNAPVNGINAWMPLPAPYRGGGSG